MPKTLSLRDLDKKVAEEFFGYEVTLMKSSVGRKDYHYKDGDAWILLPQYSKHIAATWLIVDHTVNTTNHQLTLQDTSPALTPKWFALLLGKTSTGQSYADTPSLAICYAILDVIKSK